MDGIITNSLILSQRIMGGNMMNKYIKVEVAQTTDKLKQYQTVRDDTIHRIRQDSTCSQEPCTMRLQP